MPVADVVRGRAILDIGIGAGRTTGLLGLLSGDYIGFDYSQGLLNRAKALHPGADLRWADARDLSFLGHRKFQFVMFSHNGIDSVGHDDRATVLRQIHDVLLPGGTFTYSTLNLQGAWFGRPPWRPERQVAPTRSALFPAMRRTIGTVIHPRERFDEYRTWIRDRHMVEDHGDWGMSPMTGPGSGLVVHWSTPAGTREDLRAAGLELVCFYDTDGIRYDADADAIPTGYFHIVAVKGRTQDN